MALPLETRALTTLGYGMTAIRNRVVVFPPDLDRDSLIYVEDLLAEIEALDIQIKDNIADSMAVKVQDLGLDYAQYLSQARASGTRLLERLAAFIDTPVAYNMFNNSSKSGGGSIAIKNYY